MPVLVPLAGVLIALMALLLIYGLEQLGRVLAQIFPGKIGIGWFSINPQAWVMAGVDALSDIVGWVVGDVIRPMINLVLAPAMQALRWFEALDAAINAATTGYLWLIDTALPDLAANLGNYALGLARAAENYALSLANQVLSDVRSLAAQVDAAIVNLTRSVNAAIASAYNDAVNYAYRLAQQLDNDLVNLEHATNAALATLETDVTRYVSTVAGDVLDEAETYATTAVATAVGVLSTDVGNAVDVVAPGLIEDLGSLAGVLATDFPDVGALVRSLDLTKVGSIAGAIAGTMAITDALVKLAEDCTVPNCRNLSQLGRDLQALLSLVGDASFLALIIEMVHDPSGAAGDIEGLFGGLASDTISVARDMIGV